MFKIFELYLKSTFLVFKIDPFVTFYPQVNIRLHPRSWISSPGLLSVLVAVRWSVFTSLSSFFYKHVLLYNFNSLLDLTSAWEVFVRRRCLWRKTLVSDSHYHTQLSHYGLLFMLLFTQEQASQMKSILTARWHATQAKRFNCHLSGCLVLRRPHRSPRPLHGYLWC